MLELPNYVLSRLGGQDGEQVDSSTADVLFVFFVGDNLSLFTVDEHVDVLSHG